jgi:hypothetical protein
MVTTSGSAFRSTHDISPRAANVDLGKGEVAGVVGSRSRGVLTRKVDRLRSGFLGGRITGPCLPHLALRLPSPAAVSTVALRRTQRPRPAPHPRGICCRRAYEGARGQLEILSW